MTIINPLDLETLFVDNLAGTRTIFFFLAMIAIAYFSAKWRLTNTVFLAMIGLFLIFMMGFGTNILLIPLIVVAGLIVGSALSKIIKT